MSPTSRSLAYLRKQGALVQVVEHWHRYAKRRIDLFGFIDLLALDSKPGALGIQTTTQTNVSHRVEKLKTDCAEAMRWWLRSGNRLVIHGWALRGPRGKLKTWTVVERVVTLEDLHEEQPGAVDAAPEPRRMA